MTSRLVQLSEYQQQVRVCCPKKQFVFSHYPEVWQVPANTTYNGYFPENTEAYVEEAIDYAVGAICFFTISNGLYLLFVLLPVFSEVFTYLVFSKILF